jgi:hypothetical protein
MKPINYQKHSLVFPNLPVQEIPMIINQYRLEGRRKIRQKIREWALSIIS